MTIDFDKETSELNYLLCHIEAFEYEKDVEILCLLEIIFDLNEKLVQSYKNKEEEILEKEKTISKANKIIENIRNDIINKDVEINKLLANLTESNELKSDLSKEVEELNIRSTIEQSNNQLLIGNQKSFEKTFLNLKNQLKDKENLILDLKNEMKTIKESNNCILIKESNLNFIIEKKDLHILNLQKDIKSIEELNKNLELETNSLKQEVENVKKLNSNLFFQNLSFINSMTELSNLKLKHNQLEQSNKTLELINNDLKKEIQNLNFIIQSKHHNKINDYCENNKGSDDDMIIEKDSTKINVQIASQLINTDTYIGKFKSRGSANGRPVYMGPRGGVYYINQFNKPEYISKLNRQNVIDYV